MAAEPKPVPDVEKLAASNDDAPEKYIRTFAKDMETFQKGDMPGLTPLKELHKDQVPTPPTNATAKPKAPAEDSKEKPTIEIHEDAVVPDQSAPPPPPPPTPKPPVPTLDQTPLAAAPAKESAPVLPTPPTEPPPTFHKPDGPLPIETYSGDFQEHVHDTQASTATVLAAEEDHPKTRTPKKRAPHKSHRGGWSVALGIVLLLVGGVGVYVAYTRYVVKIAPVVIAPTIHTPIFVDTQATISGSGTELLNNFATLAAQPIPPNTVELVSLNASSTKQTDVFAQLKLAAPGILLRNIAAPNTMAGVVHTAKGQSPFFILSVASYGDTFSGMLSWEPTMQKDLAPLFPPYKTETTATSTTATTTQSTASSTAAQTSTASSPPMNSAFRDESIQNHDVRVLRDAQGHSVLLYGYWDQSTLVIARDPEAFKEILTRLANAQ